MLRLVEIAGARTQDIRIMVVAEFPVSRGRELLRQCGFSEVNIQRLLVSDGAYVRNRCILVSQAWGRIDEHQPNVLFQVNKIVLKTNNIYLLKVLISQWGKPSISPT